MYTNQREQQSLYQKDLLLSLIHPSRQLLLLQNFLELVRFYLVFFFT